MVTVDDGSIIGASPLRSVAFVAIATGLSVAGYHLNGYEGPQRLLGMTLLLSILVLMALQAYTNGSWLLPFLLSPAPIVGFWLPTTALNPGPALYFKAGIAISTGLMFGLTGHLVGVVLSRRCSAADRSVAIGAYLLSAVLLLLSLVWILL